MKSFITSATLPLLAAATVFAEAPVKKPDSSYLHLSTNSPFTSKPPPVVAPEGPPPLDDWALGGVSEVEGGYMVTIFHKKNVGEMQIIRPSGTMKRAKDEMEWIDPGAAGSYKVERVEYGKESWKDTVVYLNAGGKSDKVAFDDKLIAPAASAAPAQNRPGQAAAMPVPPELAPGVINPAPGGAPPRRQRVILPPTPGR